MSGISLLLRLALIGFVLFNSKKDTDTKEKIITMMRKRENEENIQRFSLVLDKMDEQELQDVYEYMAAFYDNKKINNKELIYRIQVISKKYNIFT